MLAFTKILHNYKTHKNVLICDPHKRAQKLPNLNGPLLTFQKLSNTKLVLLWHLTALATC